MEGIPKMILANVPLWFLWDNPNYFLDSPWIYKNYCPTRHEVHCAQQQQQQMVANADDLNLVLTLLPSKPDLFSGQKRGETMMTT
jgi:hypothetical protein